MREYVELGQAPWNETPTEVGEPNYRANAIRECRAYIHAIRNYLGLEPEGAELGTQRFPHELGDYYEVVCYFDPLMPEAVAYADRCEHAAPATWADGGLAPPRNVGEQRRGR